MYVSNRPPLFRYRLGWHLLDLLFRSRGCVGKAGRELLPAWLVYKFQTCPWQNYNVHWFKTLSFHGLFHVNTLRPTHTGRHIAEDILNAFSWMKIVSCDQAALWMVFSVRLSVCPSVTPFWLRSHHRIIMKFSWVITNDQSPCKSSRSEVKGQGHRGHNPTQPFPDCNSCLNSHMMMKWCI